MTVRASTQPKDLFFFFVSKRMQGAFSLKEENNMAVYTYNFPQLCNTFSSDTLTSALSLRIA
jgi:hypothetical protein